MSLLYIYSKIDAPFVLGLCRIYEIYHNLITEILILFSNFIVTISDLVWYMSQKAMLFVIAADICKL
jgi:hypothetical protein